MSRISTTSNSAATSRGGMNLVADTWSTWWQLNRDQYVALDPWTTRPITRGGDGFGPTSLLSDLTHGAVVPALRKALDEEPGNTLRSVLLLALARIGEEDGRDGNALGSSELEEIFLAHLKHSDQGVSSSAAIALGILGRPSSLPKLGALVNDTEGGRELVGRSEVPRSVRAFAAYGVGLVGRRAANPDVQHYATHTLAQALEGEKDAAADLRVALVDALGLIDAAGRPSAANDVLAANLLEVMGDRNEDSVTRAHAPRTLAFLYPHVSEATAQAIAERLITAVATRREREPLRQGCALALGQIGDADEDPVDVRIRATLMDIVGGGNRALRSYAAIALAQAGSRAGEGDGAQRAGTDEVRDYLLRRLARVKSSDRTWTVIALGLLEREALGYPSADLRAALRESLRDSHSPELVAAHAIGSGLAADTKAAESVAAKLTEIDGDLQGQAALALGLTGSPAAIAPLRAVLAEARHRPGVLEPTAQALAMLGDDALIDDLVGLREECDCLTSRGAVALALGSTRNPRAVAPLLELLQEEGALEIQRTFATVALGHLSERQRLPWSAWITTDLNYRASTGTLSDLILLP